MRPTFRACEINKWNLLCTFRKKKPAAENVKENDNVMEMESEDLSSGTQEMADASLKPARKFNYRYVGLAIYLTILYMHVGLDLGPNPFSEGPSLDVRI